MTNTPGLVGPSWEGFCIEALATAAGARAQAYFYRDDKGNEIDLLLKFGTRLWAIEIKLGDETNPKRGFHSACDRLQPERRFAVTRRTVSRPEGGRVPSFSLTDALVLVETS